MSATLSGVVRPAVTKSPGAFSRLLGSCWHAIATYRARRAAIARLHALDDRALRDIGLRRDQIEAAVNGLIRRSDLSKSAMVVSSAAHTDADRCAPIVKPVPWS